MSVTQPSGLQAPLAPPAEDWGQGGDGGGGGAGGGGECPFDFKAYKGTITVGDAPVLHTYAGDTGPDPTHGVQVDDDVAWASQWGKVVDITFRFWSDIGLASPIPQGTVVAHIDGIGIVMGNYEQRVWLGYKDEANPGDTGAFLLHPFLLVSSNGTDWQAGYDLKMYEPNFIIRNDAILSGNVNLITRTYFKNGVIHADAGDFT